MPETKKIILNDAAGNYLHPETEAELVKLSDGITTVAEKLDTAEAGAQVNVIETVKVNGTALEPDANKAVNVVVPAAVAYTIAELNEATAGYLKTYQLYADGAAVSGSVINIPKDFLVKSATTGVVTAADKEEGGKFYNNNNFAVGDAYLDFVINVKEGSATDEHVYVNVADLVDTYTAAQGGGLTLSSNAFSIDYAADVYDAAAATTAGHAGDEEKAVKSKKIFEAIAAAKALKQDVIDSTHKLDADLVDDTTSTHKFVTTSEKSTWSGKQDALTFDNAPTANSDNPAKSGGIFTAIANAQLMTGYEKAASASAVAASDTFIQAIGKIEKGLDGKAASAHTHEGADVTALTGYQTALSAASVAASDSLLQALGKLQASIDALNDGRITFTEIEEPAEEPGV